MYCKNMEITEIIYNSIWITLYIFILVTSITLIVLRGLAFLRSKYRKQTQFKKTFLQILVPSDNEIEISAAEQFFAGLMGLRRSWFDALMHGQYQISFEIVSKSEGIGFYIVVPDELVTLVEKQINGAYPSAEIDIIDPFEVWDRGKVTFVRELKLSGPSYFPIKNYEDLETDALSSITSSMSKLTDNEVLAVQYLVEPAGGDWRSAGQRFATNLKARAADPEKGSKVDTSFVEGVEKKNAKTGFNVSIRVIGISEDKPNAEAHVRNIISTFEQFTDPNYNKFKVRKVWNPIKLVDDFIYRRMNVRAFIIPIFDIEIYRSVSVLNTAELATVFHFPNKEVTTPNMIWLTSRVAPAPSNVPTEGLYLGENIYRGVKKKIYLRPEDRRRHLYIIGQTGTGKSVFMSSLAYQDLKAGRGLAYIDPHGSEIDKLLSQMPEERMDDVILFDPSDMERPLGLNILETTSEEEKHLTINSFIALLYKLYDPNKQGIMGPLLERAIRNVMLTAMAVPGSTMVDVMRMLIDEKYHQKFLPHVKDPMVVRYWTDEVANTSQNRKGETMGYFVSKFDRFVTEAVMKNIIGQPKNTLNFDYIMENKKVLLVNLSKGKVGDENSNFIGLLIVPRILSAALRRAKKISEGEDFDDFYLYVDEFQNFATPDFAIILSEARKYKLNLTVAHQFIDQLPEEIKDAIFGNVGTMMVFRIGIDDAALVESQFEPVFDKSDIMNNVIGRAYTRLLVKGQPTVPFSLQTDWPWISSIPSSAEKKKKLQEISRTKYGTPREEVEAYINKAAGFTEEEATDEEEDIQLSKNPFF